jgi:hypothetical protein
MKDQILALVKSKSVIVVIAIGLIGLAAVGGVFEGIF